MNKGDQPDDSLHSSLVQLAEQDNQRLIEYHKKFTQRFERALRGLEKLKNEGELDSMERFQYLISNYSLIYDIKFSKESLEIYASLLRPFCRDSDALQKLPNYSVDLKKVLDILKEISFSEEIIFINRMPVLYLIEQCHNFQLLQNLWKVFGFKPLRDWAERIDRLDEVDEITGSDFLNLTENQRRKVQENKRIKEYINSVFGDKLGLDQSEDLGIPTSFFSDLLKIGNERLMLQQACDVILHNTIPVPDQPDKDIYFCMKDLFRLFANVMNYSFLDQESYYKSMLNKKEKYNKLKKAPTDYKEYVRQTVTNILT